MWRGSLRLSFSGRSTLLRYLSAILLNQPLDGIQPGGSFSSRLLAASNSFSNLQSVEGRVRELTGRLLFCALCAPAACGLDMNVKIFFAVVIAQFLPGFDVPFGPYPYPSPGNNCFCVWPARVVNIAGEIAARTSVNRPPCIDTKEVLTSGPFIYLFVRDDRAGVLDKPFSGGDGF